MLTTRPVKKPNPPITPSSLLKRTPRNANVLTTLQHYLQCGSRRKTELLLPRSDFGNLPSDDSSPSGTYVALKRSRKPAAAGSTTTPCAQDTLWVTVCSVGAYPAFQVTSPKSRMSPRHVCPYQCSPNSGFLANASEKASVYRLFGQDCRRM